MNNHPLALADNTYLELDYFDYFVLSTGDLFKGREYLESFYNLTKGRLWQTDSGENLHALSCEHLRRVYTAMCKEVL